MRRIICTTTFLAFAALPSAAFAQEATRNVNDYLCAFAGKCGEETEEAATKDAPETKGFSLSRPAQSTKKSPETKGFSLAKPAATKPTPSAPATRPVRSAASQPAPAARQPVRRAASAAPAPRATSRPASPVAASTRRADLRLTFENGSSNLTAQAREEARVFAQSLQLPELASKRFVIEGHTDKVGNRAFNIELSRQRAQAVADYLTSLGVAPARLEVKGYGFDRPLEGRSAASHENRRVEAVLAS